MRCSIFWGTYPSLLFFGFIATTTTLVIRDRPFNNEDWSLKFVPIDGGRFSENCQGFGFNQATCVLTANCTKSDAKDSNDKLRPTSLNLNKCFWYHKVDKEANNNLGWQVDWNEKDEDRQGITNFCSFCNTTLGSPYTYENNPLVLWPYCLPPDDAKAKERQRAAWGVYLDRYIANNDGYMECFGRRGE